MDNQQILNLVEYQSGGMPGESSHKWLTIRPPRDTLRIVVQIS